MANDDREEPTESSTDRWVAAQRQALEAYREVLQRMGENFQMGSYTPKSWMADVFELWDVALRTTAATWGSALGAAPDAAVRPDRVTVVRVPRGVEGWQFSVDLDTQPLRELGRVELGTRGFDPASGGFSIEHPRNVSFEPPFLEPDTLGPAKVDVALFSLPQGLRPGCYAGPIEARPVSGGSPVNLAEVHVRVAERAGPPPQHRAASAKQA